MFAYLSGVSFHMAFKDEVDGLVKYIFVFAVAVDEKVYENKLFGVGLRLSVVRQKYLEYLILKLFGDEDANGHEFDESSSHY